MYDTIKEIKDYYASVYDSTKKYEEDHNDSFGNGYYEIKISIDGTKNNFTIKILYENHFYDARQKRTSDITISFLDDGIFIEARIDIKDEFEPELSDWAGCCGNNLSIPEFIDKLKDFRGNDIYDMCCCDDVDKIIKGMIDLYKE